MAKIPLRFEHAKFETLDDGIKKSLQAWIDQHKTEKESLMLCGKYGVGKTGKRKQGVLSKRFSKRQINW